MNTTIKLKEETLNEVKAFGSMGDSWDDAVQKIIKRAKGANNATKDTQFTEFKRVNVDQWGKASISRALAGKTIEYREVKE